MSNSAISAATFALRDILDRGRYSAGDRLPPERELAQAVGLSRSTLREALRLMARDGLLESRPGSGTFVASVDVEELFAVRLLLEPFAARLAARQRGGPELVEMGILIGRLSENLAAAPDSFAAADQGLHLAVARASGNKLLLEILGRIKDLTALSRDLTSASHDARLATLRRMVELTRAVAAGNEERAEEAMRAHLEEVRAVARRERAARPRDRRLRPASDTGRAP